MTTWSRTLDTGWLPFPGLNSHQYREIIFRVNIPYTGSGPPGTIVIPNVTGNSIQLPWIYELDGAVGTDSTFGPGYHLMTSVNNGNSADSAFTGTALTYEGEASGAPDSFLIEAPNGPSGFVGTTFMNVRLKLLRPS